MTRRLEPLAGAGAPFRHSARELLAFAALKAGDTAGLRKWVRSSCATMRKRLSALRSRVDI